MVIPTGANYGITVESEDYGFKSENYDLTEVDSYHEYKLDFELEPMKVGSKITLNNIFFDFDKWELKPESIPELERAVNLLKEYSSLKVEIWGFADSIGNEEYNLYLSNKRAEAVKEYLVEHSIDEDRLTTKGFGESNPVAPNITAKGRQLNRRTEFHIIEE